MTDRNDRVPFLAGRAALHGTLAFRLSILEACKCVTITDLTGPAAAPWEWRRP
jgi:hypothetical protein